MKPPQDSSLSVQSIRVTLFQAFAIGICMLWTIPAAFSAEPLAAKKSSTAQVADVLVTDVPVTATSTTSPSSTVPARCADEIWLINTRQMSAEPCCLGDPQSQLRVMRSDTCGRLTPSDIQSLLMPDPGRLQVIYVHGNRMTQSELMERGLAVYRRLRACQPNGQPIRWIMWSWPSEREGLLLTDVRTKAERADVQAHYVAWFLRRLSATVDHGSIRMIGYSFGARVITGSLHLAAGGMFGPRAIETDPVVTNMDVRIGLAAPALHADWLGPNRAHGKAGCNLSAVHLFMNSVDPVLAGYWLLDPDTKAPAMGLVGITCRPQGCHGESIPIWQHNCSSSVGRHHDELRYYDSRCSASRALATMIWNDLPETAHP